MSDGGKEKEKEREQFGQQSKTRKPTVREDFIRAIAMIAVSQVCENEGFQGFQQSAIEALADVAVRYIREIGQTASSCSSLVGRSECNVFDVIQGLEDLGSVQGFPGASDINHSLASSGLIREIRQYVSLGEEIPFAYYLPRFPVCREHGSQQSFLQMGDGPPGEHIPVWLPAFPRPEVCSNGGGEGEEKSGQEERHKAMEKGEPSSMNVQQQLPGNNGFEAVLGQDPCGTSKMKRTAEINPFLAPPLLFGEKEISPIELPPRLSEGFLAANHSAEKHIVPATEAAQNKLCENEERDKKACFDGRPAVRFKFSCVRKPTPAPTNLFFQDNGCDEVANGIDGVDVKNEGKRRAEQILKESMEDLVDST